MEKRCIAVTTAPAATGPYSQVVVAGNLVFLSGQICLAPDGSGPKKGAFADELRQTLANVKAALEEAGSGIEHVVKTTVFLADMNHFAQLNDIYKEFFQANYPARTTIQVARLPLDVKVEIEAVAILPGK